MVWAVPLLHVKLIPHKLTPVIYTQVFGVWLNSEPGLQVLHYPVLYPSRLNYQASPKTISRKTSNFLPRLAFHPYPQVILSFFNNNRFGPPPNITWDSPYSRIDRLVSGLLRIIQSHYSHSVSLRFRINLAINP